MKGNMVRNPETRSWPKRRSFAALALITALVAISAVAAIIMHFPKFETGNLEVFTCCQSGSDQSFTIDVEVNLTDGIERDEIIKVACEVCDKAYARTIRGDLVSSSVNANENADGTWTVRFELVFSASGYFDPGHTGYSTRIMHERFEATIDPVDKTVVYSY